MSTVVILGSSRSDGDTKKMSAQLIANSDWDIIDLREYNISYYDYQSKNRDDDFLKLMKTILDKYQCLVFATPVYWYSMSGIMKVFLDRFSDLIRIEKGMGRRLRGKNMASLSCSNSPSLGPAYHFAFEQSANYLGMNYLGHIHTNTALDQIRNLNQFRKKLNEANFGLDLADN